MGMEAGGERTNKRIKLQYQKNSTRVQKGKRGERGNCGRRYATLAVSWLDSLFRYDPSLPTLSLHDPKRLARASAAAWSSGES